ncbi:winged helix-turn-helix transcriptional regulator [Nonomuraea sp. SBT364]|uniref:winged helix-turn-helix transcriptional regulator n=1 Tax=Nonomuraea sp. SBT364 TaxID=1580530 RepID=UPI00066DC681|nr:helix-turn-helix domain-containing protein [Nonomuraea sp. SBT364]
MSSFDRPGDVFLADCPARLAVEVIADKWAVVTVYALGRGPRRHGELKALIGGISSKMLTQTLRRLQHHGLIQRHAFAEVPPRVEYSLTALGETLLEPVTMLSRWAEANADAVLEAQDRMGIS